MSYKTFEVKVKVIINAPDYNTALDKYQIVARKLERGRYGPGVKINTYIGCLEELEGEDDGD